MLSSGIASRLERLQHQGTGGTDGVVCADYGAPGHSASTLARAKKGLTADLIHKFNQMSAASRAATQGRAAMATEPSRQRTPRAGAPRPGDTQRKEGPSGTGSDNAARAGIGESRAVDTQPLGLHLGAAAGRPSLFLSDSELDRALLEIREFSRTMDIALLDDAS
ncbi:hypothetical protein LPJ61_004149 [Coemansia biformis]|uniref:Uncharacterized protein n=1 Tax=Coemansia biformis TaxID=1286918 RepID=A0A9W8CXX0_9FUNG|nr:hypothetical protein LPJ61_004149 [Coemansia biformis]